MLGVDALVTCLARFIHPSALVREKYSNVLPTTRFIKTVSRRLQECIVFSSPGFPAVEFHSVRRYCKVTHEGPRKHFFGLEEEMGAIEEAEVPKAPEMVKKIEIRGILRYGDVIEVRSEGQISIDDDNIPVPENI